MTSSPVTIEQELARAKAWVSKTLEQLRAKNVQTISTLSVPDLERVQRSLDRLALSGEPVAWRYRHHSQRTGWHLTDSLVGVEGDPYLVVEPLGVLSLSPDRGEDGR
jgi:hypothetical protein